MKLPAKRTASISRRNLKKNLDALVDKLGPIEMRPIASLKNYDGNPRTHSEEQLVALAASMRQFGFTMPVLVDSNGEVIAGEARVTAAGRVGLRELPVLVAHRWSPSQVKAYRLADNRLAECATWDLSLLAAEIMDVISIDEVPIEVLGWETVAIDAILDEGQTAQTRTIATDPADAEVLLPPDTVVRKGDVWRLGKHRLLCGIPLEKASWERLMNGDTAAMSFTDLRNNVSDDGQVCGSGNVAHWKFPMPSGEMNHRQFVDTLTPLLTFISTHCHDGAVIDVCIDWRHLAELHEAIAVAGLTIVDVCVWIKNRGELGSLDRSNYELVFVVKKGDMPDRDNVKRGRHGCYRSNVWDYADVKGFGCNPIMDLTDDPRVKPVALVANAIREVTAHGDIVVDAFTGAGTTILAAERTGRIGYGIEIEPRLIDVAVRRWETLTGGLAKLEETGETFAEVAVRRCAEGGDDEECDPEEARNQPSDDAPRSSRGSRISTSLRKSDPCR